MPSPFGGYRNYFIAFAVKTHEMLTLFGAHLGRWPLPDASWRLLAPPGAFWRFLALPGASWRLLALPGIPCLWWRGREGGRGGEIFLYIPHLPIARP